MKRKDLKVILIYVLLIAGIVFFLSHMIGGGSGAKEPLTYDDVVRYFVNGDVAEFNLSQKNILTMKLQNGTELSYKVADVSIFYNDLNEVILEQIENDIVHFCGDIGHNGFVVILVADLGREYFYRQLKISLAVNQHKKVGHSDIISKINNARQNITPLSNRGNILTDIVITHTSQPETALNPL
jgi:hypothetical protein